jgi:hypothetical protein
MRRKYKGNNVGNEVRNAISNWGYGNTIVVFGGSACRYGVARAGGVVDLAAFTERRKKITRRTRGTRLTIEVNAARRASAQN